MVPALACALGAFGLAVNHPMAPWAMLAGMLLVAAWVAARPNAWLFLLPALLPVMSFASWTGWWLVDESDALVLACLAGGYARWFFDCRAGRHGAHGVGGFAFMGVWWALVITLALGVWRGLSDAAAGPALFADWGAGLYAGYDSAWNTPRVAKSLAWALLLALLLRAPGVADGVPPARLVARGMVAGLAMVCAVVLWERTAYAGLFDFSLPYRTSAWFWEMHVGGGAVDAYLALSVPFAFWAVWTAPTAWRFGAACLLATVSAYAVLTTYSRGVYLAVLISLAFMAIAAWRYKVRLAVRPAWGGRTMATMLLVLSAESAAVLGGGSFMAGRLSHAEADMVGRLSHWRSGLGLLQSPRDWILGLGLGRLPAHYSREVPGGGYPGQALWRHDAQGQTWVELAGPAAQGRRPGLFSLTQRVDLHGEGGFRVRLHADSAELAPVQWMVGLCERHLLHDHRCVQERVSIDAESGKGVEVALNGSAFEGMGWPRQGVLALTPIQAGSAIRLHGVALFDGAGRQVLHNTGFAQGLRHWFPMAQGHFEPWHIDNLYLDVLIERGVLGLAVWAGLAAWAALALWRPLRRGDALAWVLLASLGGMLSLGAVISVTEVPRVLLILLILLWASAPFHGQIEDASYRNRS